MVSFLSGVSAGVAVDNDDGSTSGGCPPGSRGTRGTSFIGFSNLFCGTTGGSGDRRDCMATGALFLSGGGLVGIAVNKAVAGRRDKNA